MLIRRFKGPAKLLLVILIFALTCAIYGGYKSRINKQASSLVSENVKNKTRYRLMIVVISAPHNIAEREAVRRTWLAENDKNVKHLFAVGTLNAGAEIKGNLITEDKANRDLLLLPSIWDSYEALTKKVLQSFSRIYNDYDFDYILKCDDDSYVVVDRVLNELNKRELDATQTGKELYWGFFNGRAQVKRTGPWKEDDWIFCDFYIPYALGGGYVLSHRLVEFIAKNGEILRLYNSEDVSIGLWLAPLSNVERKHDVRFDTEYKSRGCSNQYIITHKQTAESMDNIYRIYKASGALCLNEIRHRNSYLYDWTVPPSKCCIREPGIP